MQRYQINTVRKNDPHPHKSSLLDHRQRPQVECSDKAPILDCNNHLKIYHQYIRKAMIRER